MAPPTSAGPLCSLVTVVYNNDKTLEDTIRSVREQDYPWIEYIVIDGGSTDGTPAILERNRDRIDVLVSERDQGIYDAMNKGVARASGEVIGIVNSDDFLEPGAVSAVMAAHQQQPADLYHGHLRFLNPETGLTTVSPAPVDPEAVKYQRMPTWHPATFITRACYDEVGGYSLEHRIASDYDFLLRALAKGKRFQRIDRVLSNMRVGGVSSTRMVQNFREAQAVKVRHGCPPGRAAYYFWRSLIKVNLFNFLTRHPVMRDWVQRRHEPA